MCQFKSAICLKDRVFVPDYNSHSKMLEELHIEDDFVHARSLYVWNWFLKMVIKPVMLTNGN